MPSPQRQVPIDRADYSFTPTLLLLPVWFGYADATRRQAMTYKQQPEWRNGQTQPTQKPSLCERSKCTISYTSVIPEKFRRKCPLRTRTDARVSAAEAQKHPELTPKLRRWEHPP